MGGTASPQDGTNCPNCGQEGIVQEKPEGDTVGLTDCNNTNCAVDRFWADTGWMFDGQ